MALPPELHSALTQAGVDPRLAGRALEDVLHRGIAAAGGSCDWSRVDGGWVVSLQYPAEHRFFGATLAEALAWCVLWLRTSVDRGEKRGVACPGKRPPTGSSSRS